MTTSTVASAGGWMPARLPNGVAYIAVGAPVGSAGDWSLRGAMTATTLSSWVVLGEYKAREDRPHAFEPASRRSQPSAPAGPRGRRRPRAQRGRHVSPAIARRRLDQCGVQLDPSPRDGILIRQSAHGRASAKCCRRLASRRSRRSKSSRPAPTSSCRRVGGPWHRLGGRSDRAGIRRSRRARPQCRGRPRAPVRHRRERPGGGVRRFMVSRQSSGAMFGLNEESSVGHYSWRPGRRGRQRMRQRLGRRGAPRAGHLEYREPRGLDAIGRIVLGRRSSIGRARAQRRLHDLTASLQTNFGGQRSGRRVSAQQLPARSRVCASDYAARFDISAPGTYDSSHARYVELMVALRNLIRDPGETGSMYDELLTVAPPMRIMGGVQVRF